MSPLSVDKAVHSGFETQRRRHQKSKTGVSVAPQKGLMFSKIFLGKKGMFSLLIWKEYFRFSGGFSEYI